MGFSLCQIPTSIGSDGISTIIMSLVEDSPKARSASIGTELKRSHEISIGKNRHCGAQVFQGIKGLLAPVVPHDSCFLLACISMGCHFMQRSSNLCKLQNKPSVILCKPQKALNLSDISRDRPFLDSIYFTLISGYSLGRKDMPQVGNLSSEQLTFGRFEF